MALVGLGFVVWQYRQSKLISGMNKELETNNAFLASVSLKISRYLSPQLYKSIFAGEKDVDHPDRAQEAHHLLLRHQGFHRDHRSSSSPRRSPCSSTSISPRCRRSPLEHGGTVDKFIGDAILIFFGDPETKGVAEDARACLRMAFAMQARSPNSMPRWRSEGTEKPLPRAHGHQYRLLQCRQFRQRRPHGLYDHRRRSESCGAPAIDRRARTDHLSATKPMPWCARC